MGRKTILVDDLTGEDADEQVRIIVRGKEYVLDLSRANVDFFMEWVEGYLERASQVRDVSTRFAPAKKIVESRPSRRSFESELAFKPDPAEVRAWALNRGYSVKPGRLPRKIVEEYLRAAGGRS
jgi:hypothetical protein